MSELYSEWMVKRKKPAWALPAKIGLIFLSTIMILSSFMIPGLWFMVIVGAAFGYLTYYLSLSWDLEYEYTYVKGELDIDKIMGKTKRKRCLVIDFDHLEIMAPENSHELDAYKNHKCKEMDLSSHIPDHKKYVIYATYKNEIIRLIFEPNEKMLNDMRNTSPRKVKQY